MLHLHTAQRGHADPQDTITQLIIMRMRSCNNIPQMPETLLQYPHAHPSRRKRDSAPAAKRTRNSRQPAENRTQRITWQKQKNITAEPGQNVTLPCRAPNKNILIVEWSRADLAGENVLFYRDERIEDDNQHPSFKNRVDLQDRQMKGGDVSLILKNVTMNDTGKYECRVFMKETRLWKSIINIYLSVVAPPGPGGAPVGLIVGLIVPALLLLVAAVGFWIYRKSKEQKQDPYQPPAELQPV